MPKGLFILKMGKLDKINFFSCWYKVGLFLLILFISPVFSNELTLKECIDIALENNHELIVLKNNYEASNYKVKESKANYWPLISANFIGSRRITPLSTTFGSSVTAFPGIGNELDVTSYTTGLSLQQTIWDFGRTYSVSKRTEITKKLSFLQLEKKKREIKYQVKKSYYSVLSARAMEQIVILNLKDMESLLNSVTEKKKSGLATSLDILNVESEYIKLKAELKRINHQFEISVVSLINILGKSFDETLKLKEENFFTPSEYPFDFKNFDECKAKAISSRIEFKELELQEELSNTDISGVYSEWFPSITGTGSYELQDNNFQFKQRSWGVSLNISIPLFSGFSTLSRLESSKEDLKNIKINREQLIQNISIQVKISYYKVLEEKENINVARYKLEYLEKNFDANNAKYKEGLATITELIEAQTKKSSAKLEKENAFYNYHIALNELEYFTGGIK